jgi:DNA-binding SARP family transcriptional activator
MHLELLERLTEDCVARGALDRGLAHGRRLLRLDPAREVTHRQVMRLYAAGGDRTGALRQYRRCVQALSQEFDLDPTQETVELYRQIRTGVVAPAPAIPAPAAPRFDQRLERIEATLAALHTEVRRLREAAAPYPFRTDEAVTPLRQPLPWEAG